MHTGKRGKQGGFGLVEVLVAALVLAIGLLGIAGLISAGLKSTDSANLRTQATILAEDILERMRANRNQALAGEYDIADLGDVPDCAEGSPVSAACDLSSWKGSLERVFHGSGDSSVDCPTVAAVCVVTISFDDSRGAVGPAGDEPTVFVFRTRL